MNYVEFNKFLKDNNIKCYNIGNPNKERTTPYHILQEISRTTDKESSIDNIFKYSIYSYNVRYISKNQEYSIDLETLLKNKNIIFDRYIDYDKVKKLWYITYIIDIKKEN